MIVCTTCKTSKPEIDYHKHAGRKNGLSGTCKACKSIQERKRVRNKPGYLEYLANRDREWRLTNPEAYLYRTCKSRAKRNNIAFDIKVSDIVIPEVCPILGLRLAMASGSVEPNSPSIDKFIPDLGYVPGNIFVISHRANALKNSASIEEVESLLRWMKKFYEQGTV